MVRYISADIVYPVSASPIKHGVIEIDEQGKIINVFTAIEAINRNIVDIEYFQGALVPGFINTHCHLELSHLKGCIPENTGLIAFIKAILALRNQPLEEVTQAMEQADKDMRKSGIVAVGDISNQTVSRNIKLNSEIYYHTFVEVFGFNAPADQTILGGEQLKAQFSPLKSSIVPHAPYSVSAALFEKIAASAGDTHPITIHNQETLAENELFENGTGAFADFMASLGIALRDDHLDKKNSLHYHLPKLPQKNPILLVHNTFTSKADLDFASQHHPGLYWCLCPNANLYIEGTLPDVELFKKEGVKITLGTDSLASNHQLNILSEMKTLQDRKEILFEDSIKWATLNGAEYLGIADQFGSLEVGKKPGINLIELADGKIVDQTRIKVII